MRRPRLWGDDGLSPPGNQRFGGVLEGPGDVTFPNLEARERGATRGGSSFNKLLALGLMNPPRDGEIRRVAQVVVAAVLAFVAGQLLAVLLQGVVVALVHPAGATAVLTSASPPWWATATGLVGLWGGFAIGTWLAFSRGVVDPWPSAWRLRWSDVGYLLLGVALQGVVALIYAPFHLAHLSQPVHKIFDGSRGLTFVLLALMTAVGAPIFEEWLFRGVLFRGFLGSEPSRARWWLSSLASATLFGLAHGEWIQLPGLVLLGWVLTVVVTRTGRLVPSMCTHVGFNGIALVALVAQRAHS